MTSISVENQDVLATPCDVLILKFARRLHGVDRAVVHALGLPVEQYSEIAVGSHRRFPTDGQLSCKTVLLVGVRSLGDFGYAEIRQFARTALSILADEDCEKATLAMTMHGAGYGLDEKEAFSAQVAGMMEYLQASDTTWRPEHIQIVERDAQRARRLAGFLDEIQVTTTSGGGSPERSGTQARLPDAGLSSEAKKHVFVAMPYDEDMQDVYEFGMCGPVNEAGCLCERCDRSAFTGDVLNRIKTRIETATVVIADMTGANPNVYLEVGYAWGKGVPVLLVAKKGEQLQFDVKTHRCLYYKNISDLRKQLAQLMPELTLQEGDVAAG